MSQELLDKKARLEQLKKDKEAREALKKLKEDQTSGQIQAKKQVGATSNEFIKNILSNNAPLTSSKIDELMHGGDQQQIPDSTQKVQTELKFSPLVIEIELLPKAKVIIYDRQIQVDLEDPQFKALHRNNEANDDGAHHVDNIQVLDEQARLKKLTSMQVGLVSTQQNAAPGVNQESQVISQEEKKEGENQIQFMSKEESKVVVKSKDFENFINKTSKIIERALNNATDVMGTFFDDGEDESQKALGQLKGDKITPLFTFQDNEPLNRTITSIEWSPKVSELLMCSYSKCTEWKVDEPDGMINLYSMSLRKRPEATLISQYEVTKAIFNPFQPNIVIGATYSGYILQWDIRAKQLPVQKSCLAKNGHNHPVFSLAIVGSQNAHNIVSVSNDGKVCFWSFGMLNEPKMSFNLGLQPQGGNQSQSTESQNINVSCMDFPEDETDKFIVGSEDYNIYQCNLHSSNQQHVNQVFQGHCAPITKLHMHPGNEKYSDFSDLLLSASMDWTVKLWYPKIKREPILTFESSQEYVYDVQWSTQHPAMFATCDGDGYIDVWDINKDPEAPIARKQTGKRALNCLRWSLDGRKIAAGDSEGYVSLWSVDKDISMQKNEDFIKLDRLIQSNQQQQFKA